MVLSASLALNLDSGIYNAIVSFNGSENYNNISKNVTITIKSTIEASNIVKMYQNETQFHATFVDSNGKVLANTTVKSTMYVSYLLWKLMIYL